MVQKVQRTFREWRFDGTMSFSSVSLSADDGHAFIYNSSSGDLEFWDLSSLTKVSSYTPANNLAGGPWVSGAYGFAVTTEFKLLCINRADGTLNWSKTWNSGGSFNAIDITEEEVILEYWDSFSNYISRIRISDGNEYFDTWTSRFGLAVGRADAHIWCSVDGNTLEARSLSDGSIIQDLPITDVNQLWDMMASSVDYSGGFICVDNFRSGVEGKTSLYTDLNQNDQIRLDDFGMFSNTYNNISDVLNSEKYAAVLSKGRPNVSIVNYVDWGIVSEVDVQSNVNEDDFSVSFRLPYLAYRARFSRIIIFEPFTSQPIDFFESNSDYISLDGTGYLVDSEGNVYSEDPTGEIKAVV